MVKVYFIYKEYDKNDDEKIHITSIFEDVEELLLFVNERKRFYNDTRKIVIETIKMDKGE